MNVLAAGKAMSEQRVGARLPGRPVEQRSQRLSLRIGEIEAFSRHALLRTRNGVLCAVACAGMVHLRNARSPTNINSI